jgi:two-component system, sensor histidine kinase
MIMMSKKILIVENCYDLLDLLGEALALLGWETVLAESCREAMNKLEQDLPHVVLLDMRTLAMDGFELAATLKAHPVYKNIPILAATGCSDGLTRERCLAAGCDDLIANLSAPSYLEKCLTNLMSVERFKAITATGLEGWHPMGEIAARSLPAVRK